MKSKDLVGVSESKQTVILVDDEVELLNLYKIRLKSLNCVMLTFDRPEKFIAHIEANPEFTPDLVITDFKMPGMSGVKMMEAIGKKQFDFPSILLSGHVDKENAIQAANSGIWHILEKPVDKEKLVQLVEKLLLESRVRRLSQEIRSVTSKLSEMFSAFRILCMDELELEAMKKPILTADPNNPGAKVISLEQALSDLNNQLNHLTAEEKDILKKVA